MAVDPMRRRLTVGQGCGAAIAAALAAELADDEEVAGVTLASPQPESPIQQLFGQYSGAAKVFCITSKSDLDQQRKGPFLDKDMEVMCSDPTLTVKEVMDHVTETYPVAYKCHKGQKPESPNQDSFSICIADNDFALYGVYDGHGPCGHDVSDKARLFLVEEFLRRREFTGIQAAFDQAFRSTQKYFEDLTARSKAKDFRSEENFDAAMSGTTATMVYHDIGAQKLWIAHVGDSRAVLGWGGDQVKELTVDHKPDLPTERKRIEALGGRVVFDGFFNHRVFSNKGMYPGLNMSRALGDCIGHAEAGLTAEPDVAMIDLTQFDGEVILLLCTDGVWEFTESKEAVGMLQANSRTRTLFEQLSAITQHSWKKWMEDSDNEISDDITGIAVRLKSA